MSENACGRDLLPKRLILVAHNLVDGYHVPKQTVEALKVINKNIRVSVIAIGGKVKTGKSYLLNRLFLSNSKCIFPTSSSIEKLTRGIEMIITTHSPKENAQFDTATTQHAYILLDVQGLGGLEDSAHEYNYQVLALLLCNFYIFNSTGALDENSISSLGFMLKIAQMSKTSRSAKNNLGLEFLWVLRDFTLKIRDNEGKSISENQYLQRTLRPQGNSDSESSVSKNNMRKVFKDLFPFRSLATLPRPVAEQKELHNLNNIAPNQLRKQFEMKLSDIRSNLAKRLEQRRTQLVGLNCGQFADLCVELCKAINSNQNTDLFQIRSMNYYANKEQIKKLKKDIISNLIRKDMSQAERREALAKVPEELRKHNIFGPDLQKLELEINTDIDTLFTKWDSQEQMTDETEGLIQPKPSINRLIISQVNKFDESQAASVIDKLRKIDSSEQYRGTDKYIDTDSRGGAMTRYNQLLRIMAMRLEVLQSTKEAEILKYKQMLREKLELLESSGSAQSDHLLRLELAYLQSQNAFLKSQNKHKQAIINSLLLLPQNQNASTYQSKYNDLIQVNRNLSEALKMAEAKLLDASESSRNEQKHLSYLIQQSRENIKNYDVESDVSLRKKLSQERQYRSLQYKETKRGKDSDSSDEYQLWHSRIQVCINKTVVKYEVGNKKPYIQYVIHVRDIKSRDEYPVHRRYKSFIEMDVILHQLFPALMRNLKVVEIQSTLSRQIYGNERQRSHTSSFRLEKTSGMGIDQRCAYLQTYLNQVIQIQQIARCEILQKFLELGASARQRNVQTQKKLEQYEYMIESPRDREIKTERRRPQNPESQTKSTKKKQQNVTLQYYK